MKNANYLQRVRSLTIESMKADVIFIFFLLAVISHLYTSVLIEVDNESMFFPFAGFLVLGCFSVATILLGWMIVGSILAAWQNRPSGILSSLLGLFVGIILVLILNGLFSPSYYADFLNAPKYSPTELATYGFTPSIAVLIILSESSLLVPSIFIVLIEGYVGWRTSQINPLSIDVSEADFAHQKNFAENASYFQRVMSMTCKGIKIGVIPAILSAAVFAFYDYLNIVVADDEFSIDFYMIFFITVFIILALIFLLIGAGVLSAALSLWKTGMPNIVSGFLGLIVGVIVALIVNRYLFVNLFYGPDYDVIAYTHSYVDLITTFFPGILEVLILIYVGWRINSTESLAPVFLARK
jgi:hypothetical protein